MSYSLFQYISCCSLSDLSCFNALLSTDFNTSHVVVYRKEGIVWAMMVHISIHLML